MPVSCRFLLNKKTTSVLTCQGTAPVEAFSGQKDGRDNPDDTAMEDVGPLPKGTYYLVDRQSGGVLGFLYDWWGAHGYGTTDRTKWFMCGIQNLGIRLTSMGSSEAASDFIQADHCV
jgi:hypothetical protein